MARILIVDDSPFFRRMLTDILRQCGEEVVGEAGTSAGALKLFSELAPDIVIKDLFMPDEDAVSTIGKMVALNGKARIIVCSTSSQRQMIVSAIKAGAHDFILKPFQENQIRRAMENAVRSLRHA
ncbi:MAG: response regulator [Bacillota bacterium]